VPVIELDDSLEELGAGVPDFAALEAAEDEPLAIEAADPLATLDEDVVEAEIVED
jgi:hypothetical protein